jgi:anti-sigma regulatory factor (Ser/Thr protein kinase)
MAAGLTLTNDQTAPRAAREALSEAMAGLPKTTRSDAALLVSELVSNSVVHSPGSAQVEVFVVVDAGIVRVEVSDDSATIARRGTTSRSEHGFGLGLSLVDTLASRWGAELRDGKNVTWFELAAD